MYRNLFQRFSNEQMYKDNGKPIFDEGDIFKTFISISTGNMKVSGTIVLKGKEKLSDTDKEYRKVVNDAEIKRLKSQPYNANNTK